MKSMGASDEEIKTFDEWLNSDEEIETFNEWLNS
jgi:hypothetical protein